MNVSMSRVIMSLQNYREANGSMVAFSICAERYEIRFENECNFFRSSMIDRTNHIQLLSEQASNFVHLERADFLSAIYFTLQMLGSTFWLVNS